MVVQSLLLPCLKKSAAGRADKGPVVKTNWEAASTVLNQPKGALNIHYGIAMLDPTAYIEQLIDQCARSTFVFDFETHKTAGSPDSIVSNDSFLTCVASGKYKSNTGRYLLTVNMRRQ